MTIKFDGRTVDIAFTLPDLAIHTQDGIEVQAAAVIAAAMDCAAFPVALQTMCDAKTAMEATAHEVEDEAVPALGAPASSHIAYDPTAERDYEAARAVYAGLLLSLQQAWYAGELTTTSHIAGEVA